MYLFQNRTLLFQIIRWGGNYEYICFVKKIVNHFTHNSIINFKLTRK